MAELARNLPPGANLAVTAEMVSVAIGWKADTRASVVAVLADKASKAAGKAAFVATAVPRGAGGSVALAGASRGEYRYEVTLPAVPATVEKIIFCVIAGNGESVSVGRLGLSLVLSGREGTIARVDLTDDAGHAASALIAELYRRGDSWKLKAIAQGFQMGAEPLAKFLGCDPVWLLDSTGPAPSTPPAPTPPPSAPAPLPPAPPPPPARASVLPVPAGQEPPAPLPRRAARAAAPPVAPEDQFSCRGFILTTEGVGTPGATGIARELLDLRSDPDGGLWPAAFERQPMTGDALEPAPRLILTNGRTLGDTGLPHLPAIHALDPDSRQNETVPPGAQIFAAGGTPPRLVAVDSAAGKAWWKAPWSRKWVPIGRVPAGPIRPTHGLGLTGTADGVFFAAETALVNLLPEQQPTCLTIPFEGIPMAAPAAIGTTIALVLRGPDRLSLLVRAPSGETQVVPVEAGDESWREEDSLGAAATDGETAFWAGRNGFLALEDAIEAPSAFWRRWPPKVEGLPFLCPYVAPNGRFWAMCREIVESGVPGPALACGMTLAGASQKRQLLGPHLSVGKSTYRDHERYDAPWDDPAETVKLGADYADRWILPLLRLDGGATVVALVKDNARSGGCRGFVFREGASPLREAAIAMHRENRELVMLHHVLRISSTDEIEIFVDADRLCIHHAESNTCASWSISF